MKRRIVFTVLFLAVLCAGAWLVRRGCEPVYEGKGLRAWLEDYYETSPAGFTEDYVGEPPYNEHPNEKFDRAEHAVRQMGVKALPTLLRMTGTRHPILREKLAQFLRLNRPIVTETPAMRQALAAMGFRILGGAGRPAVPHLIAMLEDKDVEVQAAAINALGNIGPEAEAAVPALVLRALQTNKFYEQWFATCALGSIQRSPELTLPVLIQNLRVTDTYRGYPSIQRVSMHALGKFGPQAKTASAIILPYLKDPDDEMQEEAAITLKKIDPEAAAKAGVK